MCLITGKTQKRDNVLVSKVFENQGSGQQMKRHGNLWNKIIDRDNLLLAYKLARKGKGKKQGVRLFARNVDKNIDTIRQMLITKTYTTSRYNTRTIFEPKKRIIYILPFAPDRIIQHAILNVVEPIWDKLFIAESFACRKCKGIHKGSLKTMSYIRHNKYCLKCDIHHFYPSINHTVLKNIIRQKIKDKDLLWLLDDIIDSYPGDTNVPIGNYTSQWFGNLYLNELDKYVKQELHFKCYLRYCDDFLFFGNNKEELHTIANKVQKFCLDKLKLTFSKCDLFPVSRGVDFLGYRHFPHYILIRKSTAKRAKKRIKSIIKRAYQHKITLGQFRSTVASYLGIAKHANAFNFQESLRLKYLTKECKYAKQIDELASRI